MGRPLANTPVAMGLCVCPPDSLGPVLGGLCSLVWAGSPSPLTVSTQCWASWPDGSTRLGLEPTVTTTTIRNVGTVDVIRSYGACKEPTRSSPCTNAAKRVQPITTRTRKMRLQRRSDSVFGVVDLSAPGPCNRPVRLGLECIECFRALGGVGGRLLTYRCNITRVLERGITC
jgi:hypothetical protein